MSSGIAAVLIDPLLLFEVGPSVADHEPKDSQGFEQVRIVFRHFPRVRLMNREPIRHGPVLEDCPVLNRVAVAGVVEGSCISNAIRPARCVNRRGSAGSSELRSKSFIPSFTAIPASAVLRWLTHPRA